ncbi:MAG: energy transducer TonB, partial [Chitinophagales bacterium]
MKNQEKYKSFLATSSKKFLKVGFGLSIFSVIVAFSLPIYEQEIKLFPEEEIEEGIFVEEISFFKEKKVVPEKVVEIKKTETIVIKTEEIFEEETKKEEEIMQVDESLIGEGLGEEVIIEKEIPKPTRFVEIMPEFPGGENMLLNYLSNVKYCNEAMQMEEEGKVFVQFIVNEKGEVTDAEVIQGVYPCLDKAALAIVEDMPNWTPGKQGFQSVPVIMTVPF